MSRSGFHACHTRTPSQRSREDEEIGANVRASFFGSARTYGARRVWRDVLPEGVDCGLHRIELIEVQVGGYLEEDDIIRLEDAYGRG